MKRRPVRVVTTCHKAGFEQYGIRCLEGFKKWPKGTEFIWYTEGYDLPDLGVHVEQRDIRQLLPLVTLKRELAHYIPPGWQWDVVKWSHKVFAAVDALADAQEGYDGLGVWLDADAVTYKNIKPGAIESWLNGAYFACFRRKGMYTETGFWIADCAHQFHREFFSKWAGLYEGKLFEPLPQWHDCMLLDYMLKRNEKHGFITVENLSGEWATDMHPMAKSEIGAYIDHCKGPTRKELGYSPENERRKSA